MRKARITGFHLGNFKAFSNRQDVPLRPITLIFGPNNSGKSSIFHALLLVGHVLRSRERNFNITRLVAGGQEVDLGGYPQFAYRRDPVRGSLFGFDVELDSPVVLGKRASVTFNVGQVNCCSDEHPAPALGVAGINRYSFELDGLPLLEMSADLFGYRCTEFNRDHPTLLEYAVHHPSGIAFRSDRAPIREAKSACRHLRTLLVGASIRHSLRTVLPSFHDFTPAKMRHKALVLGEIAGSFSAVDFQREQPIELQDSLEGNLPLLRKDAEQAPSYIRLLLELTALIDYVNIGILRFFEDVTHIGPIRLYPPRWYEQDLDERSLKTINSWLGDPKRLGAALRLEIHPWVRKDLPPTTTPTKNQLCLIDTRTETEVSFRDVGFGISQLLPVLLAAHNASAGMLTLVEQPEEQIHPRLQAELADLFIDSALSKSADGRLFLIETHSEALILRFMRRIREGKMKPSDISVLYVDPDADGSRVLHLRLNERGGFVDDWPDGFFDERYRELFPDKDS